MGMRCPNAGMSSAEQRVFKQITVLVSKAGPYAHGRHPCCVHSGHIDPSSPLGLFLRRTRVAFRQMPFEVGTHA